MEGHNVFEQLCRLTILLMAARIGTTPQVQHIRYAFGWTTLAWPAGMPEHPSWTAGLQACAAHFTAP